MRQHGAVTRGQLVALGFTNDSIDNGLASGRLHPLHRGVYAVGHPSLTTRGHWMAAVLTIGRGALLSHRSAAALLGLRPDTRPHADVTVSGGGHLHRRAVTLHRARDLRSQDRAVKDGIPVTSLARTLLDCAAVLNERQLLRTFEEAERQRILDMRALHALAARSRGHHGLGPFQRLIAHHHDVPDTRTELERRFLDFCDEHAIPRPACNVAVEGFTVDALWPQAGLVAELDSWGFHRTRAMFESDRARDAALQVAGYRVLRVTSRGMDRDASGVAHTIRRLLA